MTTRTTANEPVAAIDPGGTHARKKPATPSDNAQISEQKVESGDRNIRPDPKTNPD